MIVFKNIFWICLFCVCAKCSLAQSSTKKAAKPKSKILVMARVSQKNGPIHIRWGVENAQAWKLSNQHGFSIERFTVLRDKKLLSIPERKLISMALKPKPLSEWERLAKEDSHAAIIAQAIYGEKFEVNASASNGVANILAQSQDLEQRFGFSLYAADRSFEGAKLAGWGYTDEDVRHNEKYFYRIKSAVPISKMKIDSAGAFVGLENYEPLPKLEGVSANFGDKSVLLSWDYSRLKNIYNAYYIERSVDNGGTFQKVSELPIANLSEKAASKRMYYIDSINNLANYQYRIAGINAFGEQGPYAEIVEGKGKTFLAFVPNIKRNFVDGNGLLQLEWEFDSLGNNQISGFSLSRSSLVEGPYLEVLPSISPEIRNLNYPVAEVTGYYKLTALAKGGESRSSYPVLVQAIDSIPPKTPTGLTVKIDTAGRVTLKWDANNERDLMGYKIFRALSKGEEPVPLIDSVWYTNNYRDLLSLKMMNKKAWYGISALDKRFNQSRISPLVELIKPVKIPPSPAIISKYKIEGGKLRIQWINSSDEDVISHTLYRRKHMDTAWTSLKVFTDTTNIYVDENLQSSANYQYVIEVENKGGLKVKTEILQILIPSLSSKQLKLMRLYAYPRLDEHRIEIVWDDKLMNVKNYQVYKAEGEEKLSLWKVLVGKEKGLFDSNLKINTSYKYGVMAVLENGSYSEMKLVTVKY